MMEKLLKFLFVILFVSFTNIIYAGPKEKAEDDEDETDVAQIGKFGDDSVKCIQNISLMREFFKQKNYQESFKAFSYILDHCPAAKVRPYVDGEELYKKLYSSEKDPVKKEKIYNDLLTMYNIRIQNFGDEAKVNGRLATSIYKIKNDFTKAYEIFKQSVNTLKYKSEPHVLNYYLLTAIDLYKIKRLTIDELVLVYENTSTYISEKMKKSKKPELLQPFIENLDLAFSPLADCKTLDKIYQQKININTQDTSLLNKAIVLYEKEKCKNSIVYVNALEANYKYVKSSNNAYQIAAAKLENDKYDEALKLLDDAINLAKTNNERSEYSLLSGNIIMSKLKDFPKAQDFFEKSISYRNNWGEPYLALGDLYIYAINSWKGDIFEKKALYMLATDYYIKAKSVDNSVSERANSKIKDYSVYFPEPKELFFLQKKEGDDFLIGGWINKKTTLKVLKK